jgi:predicted acyl esterase
MSKPMSAPAPRETVWTVRDGMRVAFDVPIRMDDGLELRADVFLPAAPGRYPALMAHGPYGKGLSFQDGHFKPIWDMMTAAHPETAAASSNRYQVWELPDPERWTREGYACVRVDSRGSGASPGVIDLFSPREIRDYHDCIEWAGTQDWCSGKVGLSGISYYAITQWLVASLQPPHLAAMFAFEGAADCYRDMSRHGGILTSFWQFLSQHQILPLQHGLGPRGYRSKVTGAPVSGPQVLPEEVLAANHRSLFAEQSRRDLDDAFYRSRSPDWSKVTVPFLSAGSWGGCGLHLRGNTEAFTEAASSHKYLEMHGLEHWTHYYTDYGFALQKRFFDRFLKDVDNGFDREPPVRLNIRHVGNRFVPRAEAEWPLARTRWTTLHLDAGRARLETEAPATAASASYAALGDGLTFLTDPMAADTEITGPASGQLSISSSTTDADLFLVLRLFGPDLKEAAFLGSQDPLTPVAMGWLRASHRKRDDARSRPERPYHSHDERQPLVPGEIVRCDVEIWPTSIVVPKGFRLGLSIRGRDYVAPGAPLRMVTDTGRPPPNGVGAMFHAVASDRPPAVFGGDVTIHTGPDHPCTLLLPVIPSS